MKKYLLLIMTMCVIASYATDHLYINDFNINAGETKVVSVMLDNEITYTAIQCDIFMPTGLIVTNMEKATRCRNHTLTSNVLDNGSTRIWVSSMSSRTISGNSGELINLTVKAANSFSGSKTLWVKNIVGAYETADNCGERVEMFDWASYINRVSLPGDMDCSGIVDVEDVNAAINVILRLNSMSDYPGNGDIDHNGIIDVEDVNAMINIILRLY